MCPFYSPLFRHHTPVPASCGQVIRLFIGIFLFQILSLPVIAQQETQKDETSPTISQFEGNSDLTLNVKRQNGAPFAEHQIAIIAHQRKAPPALVAEGVTDKQGQVTFNRLDIPNPQTFWLIKQGKSGQTYGQRLGRIDLSSGNENNLLRFEAEDSFVINFTVPAQEGDKAPQLEFQDYSSGKTHDLKEFQGKFVYLDFWATWCGPCQDPMDELNKLSGEKGEEWVNDIAMFAVSLDDNLDKLKSHNKEKGWDDVKHVWIDHTESGWPVLVSDVWGVSGIPTSFLIDREGTIIWRGHPATISLKEKLEEAIKASPTKGG